MIKLIILYYGSLSTKQAKQTVKPHSDTKGITIIGSEIKKSNFVPGVA